MSEQRIRKTLIHLCVCIVACALTALTFAADSADIALHESLKGRWEGILVGDFRSQEVSWHFEVDEAGLVKGYMGPSTAGMPSTPMENLVISANDVSFDLVEQHASFAGTISPDGIAGTWRQGTALPLQMKKRNFVFELPDFAREALLGVWGLADREAQGGVGINISFSGIRVQRVPGAEIQFEFTETADRRLSGTLSIPASNLYDIPLVDIYVTEEGFAQFATDNGRSFSGKLINGILVGDFTSPGRQTGTRSFARAGRLEQGFDLALGDADWQRMTGRWYYEVWGDDVVLEILASEDGTQRHGQLVFDEGPLGIDPLLELIVEGDTVRFTSLSGRTFSGTFSQENASEIVGEYRANGYPYRVTFTR